MVPPTKRLVDVRTTRPRDDVHTVFSKCGPIRSVHPWKAPGEPEPAFHYFVEFHNERSAALADAQKAVGMSVRALDDHPDLLAHYERVAPTAMEIDPPTPVEPPSNLGAPTSSAPTSSENEHLNGTANVETPPETGPLGDPSRQVIQDAIQRTFGDPTRSAAGFLKDLHSAERDSRPLHDYKTDSRPPPVLNTLSQAPFSKRPPIIVAGGSAGSPGADIGGFETKVIMTLCGEQIIYDLSTLDENPTAIITLLSKTGSERDKWMAVAVHYRRKIMFKSAISVALAMIEAIRKDGMNESDLKPVYLFLSGCHSDLGKRARSADGSESAGAQVHFKESKRFLQKVYGTQQPEPEDPALANGAGESTSPPVGTTLRRARADTGASSAQAGAGPPPPLVTVLQREVQSLRDKNEHLTRTARKTEKSLDALERDLGAERAYRRKLQGRLDDAEREAEMFRRSARALEERLAREGEARRHAEDTLVAERARWADPRENEVRKRESGMAGLERVLSSLQRSGMVGGPGANGV